LLGSWRRSSEWESSARGWPGQQHAHAIRATDRAELYGIAESDRERRTSELQFQNFVAAINGEAAPVNDAQQAVYLVEMLDAIYLSSHLGREVPIA
jgi:hypothetical protein